MLYVSWDGGTPRISAIKFVISNSLQVIFKRLTTIVFSKSVGVKTNKYAFLLNFPY